MHDSPDTGVVNRNTALLSWFAEQQRSLPWRRTSDPYLILVSEVMLQQTQAARVIPYYERFIASFPDVAALAAARLEHVLQMWQGLGYPSRAKRLRESARIVSEHGWPTTAAGLQDLPGVGPYTAGAVASIAFGERVAAIDTNVRRVFSRWEGTPLSGRALEHVASQNLAGDPGAWNQAVMELGALICRPSQPKCDRCPVAADCADPTIYQRPPRQPRYRGSLREVRGAVLATLTEIGVASGVLLSSRTGHPLSRIEAAIASLVADGLVTVVGSEVAVAR